MRKKSSVGSVAKKQFRLAFAPSKKLDEVLDEMSVAVGMTKSRIIAELLEEQIPMMRQVVKAVNKAKEGNKSAAMDVFAGMLTDAGFKLNESKIGLDEFSKELEHGQS